VTLPDDDSGPTKAWLVSVRNTPEWKEHFNWVFGKRPKYELYDLKYDPDETKNVAEDPAFAQVKADLEKRLMDELKRTGDPRMVNDGAYFENPPLAGPIDDAEGRGGAGAGARGKGKGKKATQE
jgi:N-sulfoglucosamine sulfohydrolase